MLCTSTAWIPRSVCWASSSIPARSATELCPKLRRTFACNRMSGPPSSATTKPNPLTGSNHFTCPLTLRVCSLSLLTVSNLKSRVMSLPYKRRSRSLPQGELNEIQPVNFRCHKRSRVQSLDFPSVFRSLAAPNEAIMQPEGAIGPEFDFHGQDSEAAPERRPGGV